MSAGRRHCGRIESTNARTVVRHRRSLARSRSPNQSLSDWRQRLQYRFGRREEARKGTGLAGGQVIKDAIHAIGEALLEVLQLPVNVAAGLLKFADVMGLAIPNQARPWSAVLVAVFIIVLPFLLDKCRSKASRIICAYGVLCLLFMFLLIGFSSLTLFARFDAAGQFEIKTIQNVSDTEAFPPIRYGNESCDANENHTNRVCTTRLQQFATASATITSANCGSRVTNVQVDPSDSRCIIANSHLQGCGYDRLPFGINNCRGRGWIEFTINGAGSSLVEHSSGLKPLAGSLSAREPLVVDTGNPLGPANRLEFKVEVRDGSKVVAELTNRNPSQGDFAASVRPDGKLQISYGRRQATIDGPRG
ncbi:hypothetical protein ACVI1K_007688 [Bradyrhizobium sp. USDA 4508]